MGVIAVFGMFRSFLAVSSRCKKPKDTDWQLILKPVIEYAEAAHNACDKSDAYFHNAKCAAESLNIVMLVCQPGGPSCLQDVNPSDGKKNAQTSEVPMEFKSCEKRAIEENKERQVGLVDQCQNVLKSMSFHEIEIMQKKNLNPAETSWINALKGLIKGMEPFCVEHINEGLSWKDDGSDAKAIFEYCPLGSEEASMVGEALEVLETMELKGVTPDAMEEGNSRQWIPEMYAQVEEEARKIGKEQVKVIEGPSPLQILRKYVAKLEATNKEHKIKFVAERKKRVAEIE